MKNQPIINRGLASILDCAPSAKRTKGHSELQLWRAGREAKHRRRWLLRATTEGRAVGYTHL